MCSTTTGSPQLNGKRYLVPGQETVLRLQADEPGEYRGQCAEFCGLSHSLMRAEVRAVTEAEFSAWIAAQKEPAIEPAEGSPAAAGLEVFLNRCTQCHTIDPINDRRRRRLQRAQPHPLHGPGLDRRWRTGLFASRT